MRGDAAPWGPWHAALLVLLVLSACTAPLFTLRGITLTGDRIAGLAAVAAVGLIAWRGGLRWTPVHSALAVFAAVQMLTSAIAAGRWPHGPKFASVYVLGFACFCLAAECAGRPAGVERGARLWIGLGAVLGVLGGAIAFFANLVQTPLWGSAVAQVIANPEGAQRAMYAAKVALSEHNLYSSFLLVPFALALWRWREHRVAGATAMAVGLVFGLTRAVWIAMAALGAFWLLTQRPSRRHVATLVAATALAFVAQAAAIGESPLASRVVAPTRAGFDWNMAARMSINRATVQSWLRHPLLGNGAGSVTGLSVVFPDGTTLTRTWAGNGTLFVLHDSGILGLAALVALVITVGGMGRRALRRTADPRARARVVALLAVGVALLFAYQFTHAFWLMYPYVYLGLIAAAMQVEVRPRDMVPGAAVT